MFDLGELLNPAALFAQLVHRTILLGGDAAHPPKADRSAQGTDHRHPKGCVS
jgi:hypothetical protein